MANELTVQDITNMSVAFAKSGLFGYKSSAEAFSLMMVAQANGIHPAKAVERYHIIQGRPAMKSEAILPQHLAGFTDKGYELAAKAVVKAVLTGKIAHLKVEY